jgi:hypothetical protein
VHWALSFASRLYPAAVPDNLLAAVTPADLGHLDEFGRLDGQAQRWSMSFVERLFDPERRRATAATSVVPGMHPNRPQAG